MSYVTYTPDRNTVMEMTLDRLAMNAMPPRHWGQFKKQLAQFNGNPPTVREILDQEAPLSYLTNLKGLRQTGASAMLGALMRAGVVGKTVATTAAPVPAEKAEPKRENCITTRIDLELAKCGITWEQLSERAGIKGPVVDNWRSGKATPSLASMEAVLNVLWWVDARKLICG